MTPPDAHEKTEQQVNDLFDSLELTQAIDTEEFRAFLDHIPTAIERLREVIGRIPALTSLSSTLAQL